MAGADDPARRWQQAVLAARLFGLDPAGLGGVVVRAGPGPVRDLWLEELLDSLAPGAPVRRIPLGTSDERLLGGLDLTATLAGGRPVLDRGILAALDGGVALLPLAERLPVGTAARVAGVMDTGMVQLERDGFTARQPTRFGLVLFDEGQESDEAVPEALRQRAAFWIDLDGIALADCLADVPDPDGHGRLPTGDVAGELVEALVHGAVALGVDALTAPLLALRAARAHAALRGSNQVAPVDVAIAAGLVLAPRATRIPELPEPEPEAEPPPPEPPPETDNASDDPPPDTPPPEQDQTLPEELVLEAVAAALPPALLEALRKGARVRARQEPQSSGGGARQAASLRGRPIGSRPGHLRSGARIALLETLRAAAPWQALRQRTAPLTATPATDAASAVRARIQVRPSDIQLRRYARRAESTVIFAVDASGSQAFHRLAEVKGAVELVLADAYAARTQVALIAFRGTAAEMLVPPTRALVRARTLLGALPGGGPTPLAAGLEAARLLAHAEKAKGRSVLVMVLTDGKANIALDGAPGRAQAGTDALAAAARLRLAGVTSVLVDSGRFASAEARELALAMGARHVPLPDPRAGTVQMLVTDGLAQAKAQARGPTGGGRR